MPAHIALIPKSHLPFTLLSLSFPYINPPSLCPMVYCGLTTPNPSRSTVFFCALLAFFLSIMERNQQHRQVALMRQALFDQGLLDEQFVQLEELQDAANPNFVEEVVTLFYRDSARIILNIDQALDKGPLDFAKLDSFMHQFKGSASSIGAKKVKSECTLFKEYCMAGNGEGCKRTFQQLKKEYTLLKKKLETYFQLARQVGPRETACRSK